MSNENIQFQQTTINPSHLLHNPILGESQQIISTKGEDNRTNVITPLADESLGGTLDSATLNDLRDIETLSDRYCELDYRKLSGEKLTEEEEVFMVEIERQFEHYPPPFSTDPEYIAAKKELEKLKGQSANND